MGNQKRLLFNLKAIVGLLSFCRKTILIVFLISQALVYSSSVYSNNTDSLLAVIQSTADPVIKMELYIKVGDMFEYTFPDQAIFYFSQAYEISNQVRDVSNNRAFLPKTELLRAKSLRYIGIVHSNQGNYEEALDKYFEAKKVLDDVRSLYVAAERNIIDLKYAKLLNNIAVVYSQQSIFKIAKEYNLAALEVHERMGDLKSIAVVNSSLGILEARQANLTQAQEYFHKALELYTLLDDKEGVAQTYNNIGNVYLNNNGGEESIPLYYKAYEIFAEMNYLQRMGAVKNNLGRAYHKTGNYKKSIDNLNEGLKLRKQINDRKGQVESYVYMGDVYFELSDFGKALECFNTALEISDGINDRVSQSRSYISLGKVYSSKGNQQLAIEKAFIGLEIAQEYNLKYEVFQANQSLASFYRLKGDYRNAYDYFERSFNVHNEILNEQKVRQLAEMEVGYQARVKQQQIEYLEQQKQLQDLKLSQSNTLIYLLSLLFLIVLIVGIFSILLLKQRSRLLLFKSERDARSRIRKTSNDFDAILQGHAHAMILTDDKLDVIALNTMAEQWFKSFSTDELSVGDSLYSISHPILNDLIYEQLFFSLRGESREREIEIALPGRNKRYYKVFTNPVYEEPNEVIQSVSIMIEDITLRRANEERIIADLKEKETLIKEIHHRVKNNLQVIISLIRLQNNEIKDQSVKESFKELEQRVSAMSFVHEELYKSDNLSDINFEEYLKKITANLSSIYKKPVSVNNHFQLRDAFVNIDIAVPCGLVVNELLSNAFKHAFNGAGNKGAASSNNIDIRFTEHITNFELVVSDNGKGVPKNFDFEKANTMGLHLVKVIVEDQLRGEWKMHNGKGLTVVITFPKGPFNS
jgi:two-component system, sensor histidine kinase PdtaS